MIEILAAFAIQIASENPVITIPRECPTAISDCVMSYGEWEPNSENLPVEYPPLDVSRTIGSIESIEYVGLSSQILGRLNGGEVRMFTARFQNHVDIYSPCRLPGHNRTNWPTLGYAPSGNPIIVTSQGELEIVSSEPDFDWTDELVIADAETLAIMARVPQISEWDTYFYDGEGEVYLQLRDGKCFIVPVRQDSRYEPRDRAICEMLAESGGRPEVVGPGDPAHAQNLEFDFANSEYGWVYTYWLHVLRVPNLPDRLILDIRNPCT